jgi:hypothetical protein
MLNLVSNQANICYTLARGSAPYTIRLVKEGTTEEETFTITLTDLGVWQQFTITPTLTECDGNYFLFGNSTEIERGMIKVDDGTSPATDIEYDPRT